MPAPLTQLAPALGRMIGADEAGYGPNLGPLVVSVTQWDLPQSPRECDLWRVLRRAVCQKTPRDGRLQVADSKQVYQSGQGLAALERSVLTLLAVAGRRPGSWSQLRSMLTADCDALDGEADAPWYTDVDLELPVAVESDDVDRAAERFQAALRKAGIELTGVRSDVVTEPRFNRLTEAANSKGAALTEVTLKLIRSLWSPGTGPSTLVIGDKHGGRTFYAGVLTTIADGEFVSTQEESRPRSRYELAGTEFRFEAKGERHLPVAAASMVSKYVREISMLAVNAFWRRHLPDLKPTQGYPGDASRFREQIAATQRKLGLPDHVLWRRR